MRYRIPTLVLLLAAFAAGCVSAPRYSQRGIPPPRFRALECLAKLNALADTRQIKWESGDHGQMVCVTNRSIDLLAELHPDERVLLKTIEGQLAEIFCLTDYHNGRFRFSHWGLEGEPPTYSELSPESARAIELITDLLFSPLYGWWNSEAMAMKQQRELELSDLGYRIVQKSAIHWSELRTK